MILHVFFLWLSILFDWFWRLVFSIWQYVKFFLSYFELTRQRWHFYEFLQTHYQFLQPLTSLQMVTAQFQHFGCFDAGNSATPCADGFAVAHEPLVPYIATNFCVLGPMPFCPQSFVRAIELSRPSEGNPFTNRSWSDAVAEACFYGSTKNMHGRDSSPALPPCVLRRCCLVQAR